MKNAGFTSCHLTLSGMDGSWKQVLNQNVIDAHDAREWTALTAEYVVPAQAVNTRLAVVVGGEGQVWLDDVVIEKTAPVAGSNLARNGSWKMLKWLNVFNKPGDAGFDWTAFGQTVQIPAEAVIVNLAPGLDGEGSVWFDDIEVSEVH